MYANVKNKSSNGMREEILSIACDLKEGSMTLKEAQAQLLRLLSVVGRSEQLVCPNCDGEGFSGKGTNEILPCLSCFGSGERAD